jgi:hypothetical protein
VTDAIAPDPTPDAATPAAETGGATTSDASTPPAELPRRVRARRRVTTAPPAGTDPSPQAEPERHALEENDERLRAEKPPHY